MARKKKRKEVLVRDGNDEAYTPIPHEYLLYLARLKLAPNEWRVLMVILRHTLGWHGLKTELSLGALGRATGIRREHVARAKVSLAASEVIAFKGQKIELLPVSATLTMQLPLLAAGGLPESAMEGLPESAPFKDIHSKLPQKERAEDFGFEDLLGEGIQQQQGPLPLQQPPEGQLPDKPIDWKAGVVKFHERTRRVRA